MEDDRRNVIGSESDERSGGEDDEKEMGFISASAMDPAQFDKMDQEVRPVPSFLDYQFSHNRIIFPLNE